MNKLKLLTKCCKPLGARKCSKNLRNVVPWMQKKNLSLTLNQKICDSCRKALEKTKDVVVESPLATVVEIVENGEDSNDSVDIDPPYVSKEDALNALNKFLVEAGLPQVDTKRLAQKNYCHASVAAISGTLRTLIFHGYPTESEIYDSSGTDILNQLKDKFRSSTSKSEKTTILTLTPRNWSIMRTKSEFEGASDYMIRKSKKLVAEKGILSSPNVKCGRRLPSETETLITNFYMNDEFSRLMPGKKDFVSVRTANGRVHEQKRLILCNLKELHAAFKERNSSVEVCFSKFAILRPRQCVLAGASGTHSVCVCQIHQNPKLMLEACDLKSLQYDEFQRNLSDYHSLLKVMTCENPKEQCHLGSCKNCPDTDVLRNMLSELFDENNIETITYKQWTSTDRSTLETVEETVEDFLDTLIDSLVKLRTHSFIAKQQTLFLNDLKATIAIGIFLTLLDFSENFSFLVQDAVQGFHWNNSQATIHPFVFYFKDENNVLQNGNFVIISDCLKHDSTAVNLFVKHYLTFLKKHHPAMWKMIYFSDGCGGQYKNKYNFLNISYHQSDFDIETEWHFFATSHGKSASDGIGGTLKRLVTKASLQRPLKDQIVTPKQMYDWAKLNITGMNFHYVSQEEYDEHHKLMAPRFDPAKTLNGTRKQHAIYPVQPGVIKTKIYSNDDKCVEHKILKKIIS